MRRSFHRLLRWNHLDFYVWMISLILLLVCSRSVCASAGDDDWHFRDCAYVCERDNCTVLRPSLQLSHRTSWLWTCKERCEYNCSYALALQRVLENIQPLQYRGKWVFHSVLGLEEPASVFFSIGNFVVNMLAFRRSVTEAYALRWKAFAIVSCHTWLWTIAFHARDMQVNNYSAFWFFFLVFCKRNRLIGILIL